MLKKSLLILILLLLVICPSSADIVPLHHDTLDGFVSNEHIDWTDASENFKTSGTFHLTEVKTPVGSGDTGITGQVAFDDSYGYRCVATNTWKRWALSTFAVIDIMIYENGDTMLFENGDTMIYE